MFVFFVFCQRFPFINCRDTVTLLVHLCALLPESSGLDFVLNYNSFITGFSPLLLTFLVFSISLNGLCCV